MRGLIPLPALSLSLSFTIDRSASLRVMHCPSEMSMMVSCTVSSCQSRGIQYSAVKSVSVVFAMLPVAKRRTHSQAGAYYAIIVQTLPQTVSSLTIRRQPPGRTKVSRRSLTPTSLYWLNSSRHPPLRRLGRSDPTDRLCRLGRRERRRVIMVSLPWRCFGRRRMSAWMWMRMEGRGVMGGLVEAW